MIGDELRISPYHKAAGHKILESINEKILKEPLAVTISGESGCGKTEIAECVQYFLRERGMKTVVLNQDDYFHLPPHSNHRQRTTDLSWVGPGEVRLELMNAHMMKLLDAEAGEVVKPLVFFEEDTIRTEVLQGPYDAVIAEGTYTALLKGAHFKVFVDRNYMETEKDRIERNRDQALNNGDGDNGLDFLLNILKIEHHIISKFKVDSDLIIPPPEILLPKMT